jgi:hypothetical protein
MTENNLNNTAVSQIPTWFERKFECRGGTPTKDSLVKIDAIALE